jgi:[protein-PII] uridylyltransferase
VVSDVIERRRAAALRIVGDRRALADRITAAPDGYVLAHDSTDIVRHCALLSPLPSEREARAVVTPGRAPGEWHLDVGSRDQVGLLAAFAGVLVASGIDVVQAVLATWADGGALQAFIVRAAVAPDAHALERAFEASLRVPLASDPVDSADVVFDDEASELYTRCDLRSPDQPGLLHAFAVAIAAAGADVHAARVATIDGVAHDVFDLSERGGGKLAPPTRDAIRTLVRTGVTSTPRRRRRSWSRPTARSWVRGGGHALRT